MIINRKLPMGGAESHYRVPNAEGVLARDEEEFLPEVSIQRLGNFQVTDYIRKEINVILRF